MNQLKVNQVEFETKKEELRLARLELDSVAVDISEYKKTIEKLRESEAFHKKLLDVIPIPVFYKSRDGRYLGFNLAFEAFFGESKEELVGKNVFDINPPDMAKIYHDQDAKLLENPGSQIYDSQVRNVNGVLRDVVFHKASFTDMKGSVCGLVGAVLDITERKQAEEDLMQSEAKFRAYTEMSPMGIFVVNHKGNFIEANQAACQMTGYTQEELLTISIADFLAPESLDTGLIMFQKLQTQKNGSVEGDILGRKKDNEKFWASLISVRINEKRFIAFCQDITQRKQTEEKIHYISYHDNLTGLYNRLYLEEEMDRLDTKRQLPISIIMADLNGLKLVNDTYGHNLGDAMLKITAGILRESCRKEDIIARWGGDEFVIFLTQTSEKEAQEVCDRVNERCRNAYVQDIPISIALGFANKYRTEKDLSEVLKEAEDNMYKSKITESRSEKNALLHALLNTLKEKSRETEDHALRMHNLALKVSEKLGLPESELKRLDLLITLHDVGKIKVPETILTKKGALTKTEWEIMKKHPETGFRIARTTVEFAHVAEDILAHHERWDGSGYPHGLKGKAIPLLARITAIADAHEVMTNGRPYKKAMSTEAVVAELKRCAGTQFDPELIDVFLVVLAA